LEVVVLSFAWFAFRHLRISKNVYAKESKGNWFRPLLIQKNLDFAKESGYKNVYLESMPELKQALKIYETFGFHYIAAPMGNIGHYWL
jgi:putative acetyltransferase